MSNTGDDLALLERAKTPAEAKVIFAVLQSSEIPAFINGELLQDPYAISQLTMNLSSVDVQVPRPLLEKARQALVMARRFGAGAGEEQEPGTPGS